MDRGPSTSLSTRCARSRCAQDDAFVVGLKEAALTLRPSDFAWAFGRVDARGRADYGGGGSWQPLQLLGFRSVNGQADDADVSGAVAGVTVVVGVANFESVVAAPANVFDGLFGSAVDRGRSRPCSE
jgi:hypothetical protein